MTKKRNDKLYNVGRPEAVERAYHERLGILKKAQDYAKKEQIPEAVQNYSYYLNILAQYHGVSESDLSPAHFNRETDMAEMLLISHAYWDLAKAYDRSPTLGNESIRCLKQFVNFTLGFKFQFANALMVKKYLRQNMPHNPQAFRETLEKIRIESKGCYLASFCYGSDHPTTQILRHYRDHHLVHNWRGRIFIHCYQTLSPQLVAITCKLPLLEKIMRPAIKGLVRCFMHFHKLRQLK